MFTKYIFQNESMTLIDMSKYTTEKINTKINDK